MLTKTCETVTVDNIFDIISDTIHEMGLNEILYKTVDPEHFWDGTIQSNDFRNVRGVGSDGRAYECYKMLTFGSFTISVKLYEYGVHSQRFSIVLSYNLAPYSEDVDRLRSNSINRKIDHSSVTIDEFVAVLRDKARSLVDAVTLRVDHTVIGTKTNTERYLFSMVHAIGTLRRAAKMEAMANPTAKNTSEINDLVERVAELLVEEINRRDGTGAVKLPLYMYLV